MEGDGLNADGKVAEPRATEKDKKKRIRTRKRKQAEVEIVEKDDQLSKQRQPSKAFSELQRLQLQTSIASSEADFILAKEIGGTTLELLIGDKSIPTHVAGHYYYLMSIVELWLGNYQLARQNSNKAAMLFYNVDDPEIKAVIRQFNFVKNLKSRLIPCSVSHFFNCFQTINKTLTALS
jgi:hypothetical protein